MQFIPPSSQVFIFAEDFIKKAITLPLLIPDVPLIPAWNSAIALHPVKLQHVANRQRILITG